MRKYYICKYNYFQAITINFCKKNIENNNFQNSKTKTEKLVIYWIYVRLSYYRIIR